MADATKDAAVYEMSDEQAQKKKLIHDLFTSKKLCTFAPDDEAYYGWWLSIGCSLNAIHSRMWN